MEHQESDKHWQILARRTVYDGNGWIDMQLVDVRLPDGKILRDLHLVDYKYTASGIVPIGIDGKVLLIDHYRYQTDTRGWEIPAGKIDEGESPEQAAARELLEETGHRAASFDYLGEYFPSQGSANLKFHAFVARGVAPVGAIQDTNEVIGLNWFTPAEIRAMIAQNELRNGLTLTALCWAIARGEF